jgi:hypothetical protein
MSDMQLLAIVLLACLVAGLAIGIVVDNCLHRRR